MGAVAVSQIGGESDFFLSVVKIKVFVGWEVVVVTL